MLVEAVLASVTVDHSDLEERVYAVLRQKILDRDLVPGDVLTIRQVAAALSVSPTPVRDALRRLQAEALVRDRGRLGAEVVGLSANDIVDLFGARTALETYAAGIAGRQCPSDLTETIRTIARQFPDTFDGNHYTDYERFATLDAEFHHLIIEAAKNARLLQMYRTLHVHIHLARIYQREIEQRAQANHREHLAIVEALIASDPVEMTRAVTMHIENVRDHILQRMGPGNVVI